MTSVTLYLGGLGLLAAERLGERGPRATFLVERGAHPLVAGDARLGGVRDHCRGGR